MPTSPPALLGPHRLGSILCLLVAAAAPLGAQDLPGFRRGDCNADGGRNISDPIYLLEDLFGAGTPDPCLDACDANDDGLLDLADAITMLGLTFTGTPATLPAPDICGFDPTPDPLGCAAGTCVAGPLVSERSFTLETAREGLPYVGDLPANQQDQVAWSANFSSGVITEEIPYVAYGVPLDSTLPGALALDTVTGALTGPAPTPGLHAFRLWAQNASGEYTLFHAELPAFDAAESAILPGQTLTSGGSFLVSIQNHSFDFVHDLPWPLPYPLYGCSPTQPATATFTETKDVRVYYPLTGSDPTPLLIFHHGTGFDWTSYQGLMVHLASHGITSVTVEDQYSYGTYADDYCWGGHDESARVMLAVRGFMEALVTDPANPLHERIDWDKVFYGGHSRGGGAAVVARELDPDVRGLLLLQGTDVRRDSFVGYTNRWIELPDVPVMSITAEQDTDVFYPYSERIIERFTGPATMVTIYGGCHAYSSDNENSGCALCDWEATAPAVDNCRYISRDLQLELTKRYATAFFRRYAYGDLSVEGLLHGSEAEGSPYVAVTHRRNLSGGITVADFDDFPLTNLGGMITAQNTLLFIQGACYDWPFPLPSPIEAITNLVLIADPNGVTPIDLPLRVNGNGAPLDVTGREELQFRIKNHDIHGAADNIGYGHVSLEVRLEDADGEVAVLSADPHLPQVEFHPEPEPPTLQVPLKYQRFLAVALPVSDFIAENPLLDVTRLAHLRFTFTTNGTAAVDVRIGLDDVRFE